VSDLTLIDPSAGAQAQALVGAGGTAQASFLELNDGDVWQISRAVVACGGAGSPTCVLNVVTAGSDPDITTQRSGTNSGRFDEADYAADGLQVVAGEQLIAVWVGATPDETAVATITYRLYQRDS
jgi:hypothetical protein